MYVDFTTTMLGEITVWYGDDIAHAASYLTFVHYGSHDTQQSAWGHCHHAGGGHHDLVQQGRRPHMLQHALCDAVDLDLAEQR